MSRFRLLPSAEQERELLAHCRDARYVWNLAVEQQRHWQPGRRAPGYGVQAAQLTDARAEYEWLRAGSQTVQQQALRDFAQAMRSFFNGTHHRPKWRKAGVDEGFRQVAVKPHHVERLNRRFGRVWVPKVGWVRFGASRPVPDGVKSYRVTRDRAGRWHVAFAHIPEPIVGPGDGSVVGIDRGVTVSAALSTGELLCAPSLTAGESKRLKVLQQRLARAKRGSNRRVKTKRAIAKLKARETDRRRDWVEKATTDISRRFEVIRVESLHVQAMTRSARGTVEHPGSLVAQKRGLNRKILKSGWGQLLVRLQHKAMGRVEQVPAAYTSQRCSACGHVASGNRKNQAVFECEACSVGRCHADVNAARNIAAGRAVTARGDLAVRLSANREPQPSTSAAQAAGRRSWNRRIPSGEDVKTQSRSRWSEHARRRAPVLSVRPDKMVRMPLEVACSSIIDDLDDEQREAVLAARGPVCVLAGAGTGKTRTITRRIAHLVSSGHVAPGQVLAVTFTQRAAGEMRARLRALDAASGGVGTASVQAMTFHAAARRQLAYFWPRVVGNTGWELLDTKFAVVAQSANRAGLQASTDDVRDLAGEIEWAKGSLISPEAYPAAVASAGRDIPFDAAKVAAVYTGYETLKARRDGTTLLDFDDLLLHTAAAIENDAAVAQEFRDRYRCFVVDEYQDVTPLQQRVLDAWLGDRDDLTVVGDANQTIYSFTGATPQYLLDFSRRFPDAAVVRLERDYRSTPQVVSLANRVIAAARGRMAGSRLHLVGQRDPGPAPTFAEHPDEVAEAASVAKNIKRLIGAGTAASEIAVLYRINAQSEVYEEALTEAGIPFQVRGGEGFFSRQEVRQSLVAMQRAAERDIEGPLPEVVRAVLEPLGLTAEPPAGTKARERWEALTALAELVDEEVAQRPSLDLPALLTELRQRADARHPPVVQGVTLASLHAAKGLEWDAVFLVGLADGTLPISHALTHGPDSEPVEEERRLLYVGITRARMHLALSWALARAPGGRQSRKPSRFLNGVAPQASGDKSASRARRPKGATPRCRVCNAALTATAAIVLRRCEGCPSDIDENLLVELKDWRLRTSKEMSVPAYVVFTDNTLIAIAETLPGDDAALVAIPGIGARKLEQFGADVLALVKDRSRPAGDIGHRQSP